MLGKNTHTSIALLLWAFSAVVYGGVTNRVSVGSDGLQGNDDSYGGSISADGRFVGFTSLSTNLVPGDNNSAGDAFIRDRAFNRTRKVFKNHLGSSGSAGISADGRFVVLLSKSPDLVPGDTNGVIDVFVHDRLTGKTARVSVGSNGQEANADSGHPSISADGRFVAFDSNSTNLIPGDTNNASDIFIHDRVSGQTKRVSVNSMGRQGNAYSSSPSISADGRFVAFESDSSNFVPGDTTHSTDVFVRDRLTGQTTQVNVKSSGLKANFHSYKPSISADGRFVAFESSSTDLVPGDTNDSWDVFVHDRVTGQTNRVSINSQWMQGDGGSGNPSISSDGRFVAFESDSRNLDPDDDSFLTKDIFVRDRLTGQTKRVSVNSAGLPGNGESFDPSISTDGRYVTFASKSSNLVPRDTNNLWDVFVHDRLLDTVHHADIRISTIQKPVNLAINSIGTYVYKVTNSSVSKVDNVKLTHIISDGSVINFMPSQGICKRYATISLCNLGSLSPGSSMTVQMRVKATGTSLGLQTSVSAPPIDDFPFNNLVVD